MRPTSGMGSASSASNIFAIARASRMFSPRDYPTIFDIHVRSAPAENTFPAPANTATRGASGRLAPAATDSAHDVNWAISSSLKALRTSGRLRVTRTTGPSVSMSSVIMLHGPRGASRLHAKHAELRVGNRRVERRRQAERERLTRFGRIQNPIVPQARGGVVR